MAFRESLNYYDHVFHESNDQKAFPVQQFGAVPGLQKWKWDHVISIKYRSYKTSTVKLSYGEDTVYHVKI